jgi:hypothetical protein
MLRNPHQYHHRQHPCHIWGNQGSENEKDWPKSPVYLGGDEQETYQDVDVATEN